MITINLLPRELALQEKKQRQKVLIILAAALLVLLFLGNWVQKLAYVKTLEADVRKVEGELKSLETQVRKVEEIERNKTLVNQQIDIINTLLLSRLDFPKLMEVLTYSDIIPPRTWLIQLAARYLGDAQIELEMDVQALDNYAVADLLTNLGNSLLFEKITLD